MPPYVALTISMDRLRHPPGVAVIWYAVSDT